MIRMYNAQKEDKGRFTPIKMLMLVVIMVLLAFFGKFGPDPEKEMENMESDSYITNESIRTKGQSSCF